MMAEKPYELTLVNRKLYVYAHVKADVITREIGIGYLTEAVEACHRYRKNRLMIYRDIPKLLPDKGIKEVSIDFARMIGDIKTAAVNPYLSDDAAHDSLTRFIEGTNYRLFTNFKDAEKWLLSTP